MDLLYISFASIASIIILFLLTKLMGYRQVSQLSMFDYINGITIGSIAAEMATALETDIIKPAIAMIIYALAAIFFSWLSEKSIFLRKFIVGHTLILMDHNTIYYKNMKKAHIDVHEFLSQCRIQGYFDLNQIETVFFEPDGRFSIMPKGKYKPVTNNDLNLPTSKQRPLANIIIDSVIMEDNLKAIGKDKNWLLTQLHKHHYNDTSNILLATANCYNQIYIYEKTSQLPDTFIN